ncbi:MAG TPA: fused MFS/spermidine synthase, partial [Pirellulales bacterium]|nr:fused MFS/spermidine synthase [Pirellulales bacterium]
APLLFKSLLEYPLAMSAACLFSPLVFWRWPKGRGWLDLPIAVVVALLCAVALFRSHGQNRDFAMLVSMALCFVTLGRPVCFAISAAALLLMIGQYYDVVEQVQLRERDFYGVLRVKQDPQFRYLLHGRILHGTQRRDSEPEARNVPLLDHRQPWRSAPGVRHVPLLYYYPTGPIGQVFRAPLPALQSDSPVAVIGLGVGSLAYYGRPQQEFTFYEIDPAVEKIASNEEYFTFLRDSRAKVRVVLGDARLSLQQAPAAHYALIVVDAFSGDAIPVHLLTHEAMQLYVAKLAPGGVLAFHISNNFLDLAPVLGNLASASQLVGLDQNETVVSDEDQADGKSASHWAILARREADFGPLANDERWRPLAVAPEIPLWTDHYTSLWGVARWNE